MMIAIERHLGATPVVIQLLQALDGHCRKVACARGQVAKYCRNFKLYTILAMVHVQQQRATDSAQVKGRCDCKRRNTCVCRVVGQHRRPASHKGVDQRHFAQMLLAQQLLAQCCLRNNAICKDKPAACCLMYAMLWQRFEPPNNR